MRAQQNSQLFSEGRFRLSGGLARSNPRLHSCADLARNTGRATMNLQDLLYVAIVIAFFVFFDWIVGLLDERTLDSRR